MLMLPGIPLGVDLTFLAERSVRSNYLKDNASSGSVNPLTPNDLYRRRAVSPLKIKIPSKNMRQKPTNIPIIHSVY
jgi:hypothetical protein